MWATAKNAPWMKLQIEQTFVAAEIFAVQTVLVRWAVDLETQRLQRNDQFIEDVHNASISLWVGGPGCSIVTFRSSTHPLDTTQLHGDSERSDRIMIRFAFASGDDRNPIL